MNTIDKTGFDREIGEVFESIRKLSSSKGAEYRGSSGDANVHANFDRLAAMLDLSPEKVLMVYFTKHMDSITSYVNNIFSPVRPTLSEPISGRIDDAILYLILLRAMSRRRWLSEGKGETISVSDRY